MLQNPAEPKPLDMNLPFTGPVGAADMTVGDFWRWSASNLLSNTTRGVLAEFIVARALGCSSEVRADWDPFDLKTPEGTTVEVKSAAYLQSWHQTELSQIRFSIRPTRAWDKVTNTFDDQPKRQADAYVFALFDHELRETANTLDLDQWRFYVVRTSMLDEQLGAQKTLSLSRLLELSPLQARFDTLARALKNCD